MAQFSDKTLQWFFGAIIVVGVLAGLGLYVGWSQPKAIVGGAVEGQPVSLQPAVGNCPDSGTCDLQSAVRESIADTNGVKNQVRGSMAYYYANDVTPFETTTTATSGYVSSTIDPQCAGRIFGIFTNSSYYSAKTELFTLPYAPSQQLNFEADLIATMTVTGHNETDSTWGASGITTDITTGETMTDVKLRLKADTARGIIRQPAVCENYDIGNFTGVEILGGRKIDVPTGICSGYEEAWQLDVNGDGQYDASDKLVNFNSIEFTPKFIPATGADPATAVTFTVIDLGTYTKATNGVLFEGYQNIDTKADTGATNVAFVVNVD